MLYTFSLAEYDSNRLSQILDQVTENDAVLLWQDGVLQAVKNPKFFAKIHNIFVLKEDIKARHLKQNFKMIGIDELVQISEQYYPQIAF